MSGSSKNLIVTSPCKNVCRLNFNSNLCNGCGRTIEEITNWSTLSNSQKKEILIKIEQGKKL